MIGLVLQRYARDFVAAAGQKTSHHSFCKVLLETSKTAADVGHYEGIFSSLSVSAPPLARTVFQWASPQACRSRNGSVEYSSFGGIALGAMPLSV